MPSGEEMERSEALLKELEQAAILAGMKTNRLNMRTLDGLSTNMWGERFARKLARVIFQSDFVYAVMALRDDGQDLAEFMSEVGMNAGRMHDPLVFDRPTSFEACVEDYLRKRWGGEFAR